MEFGDGEGETIALSTLAERLRVPAHTFSYLERQIPGICALSRSGGRRYRMADAAILAAVVGLTLEDGVPLKTVRRWATGKDRARLLEDGLARLDAAPPLVAPLQKRVIPPDIQVRGGKKAAAAPEVSRDRLLQELMQCVSRLGGH